MAQQTDWIGGAHDRIDGTLKVQGRATYTYEHQIPNAAFAVLLTSRIAKGRINSIDASQAEREPGVLLVMTHQNAPRLASQQGKPGQLPGPGEAWQALQDDRIQYANQPVAVVVAKTSTAARAAAELIKVDYAAETAENDLESRLHQAYAPKKAGGGGDPAESHRGDADSGLKGSELRLDQVYRTPFQFHNPMETHATIAEWTGNEALTVYDTTQGVFGTREKLEKALGLKPGSVRVISPYLGGGFGSKGPTWSNVILAALAAKQAKCPVRLEVSRPQMFNMVGLRSETRQAIAIGAGRDGQIQAIQNDCVSHTSSFGEFVEAAALASRMLYESPNNRTSHRLVRSNIGQTSYMRAPGEATGVLALELAMDEMAYKAGMDPIAFRVRNYAENDPEEHKPWSSKGLRACYTEGAARFGWADRNPKPRSMRRGEHLVGYGMATAVYPTRRSEAEASATLRSDGMLLVDAGTQDIGTGTYTIMTQIAAEAFGVDAERVAFKLGDTILPKTPVSGGSQTAASTGSAVLLAAQALKEKLLQMASSDAHSQVYGVSMQDLRLEKGDIVAGNGKREPVAQLLQRTGQPQVTANAQAKPGAEKQEYSMYAFGAQFAEVHVDEEIGQITIARLLGCFATGRILNAKTARSQFIGGMVWGASMALYEEALMDKRLGRWVNNNLAEYHVPVNLDIREVDAFWVDEVDQKINPLGAKGIGEIGITGAAAAVVNAIFHATGKRFRTVPVKLEQVMA